MKSLEIKVTKTKTCENLLQKKNIENLIRHNKV